MFGDFAPCVRRRVVVTGVGLVTPVGIGVAATWRALCAGRTGTRPLAQVPHFLPSVLARDDTRPHEAHAQSRSAEYAAALLRALPCQVAAPVCDDDDDDNSGSHASDDAAATTTTTTARRTRFCATARESRALLFARFAVHEALCDAHLLATAHCSNDAHDGSDNKSNSSSSMGATRRQRLCCDAARTGVNIGVGVPSLSDIADAAVRLYAPPPRAAEDASGVGAAAVPYHAAVHPYFVPKILGNMPAGVTAIEYGITGPIGSSVAACATGAHCIGEAAEWVRSGRADVVVCGATEACLTPLAVAGFARMRALCTRHNASPATASRPFDRDRGGFVMGEGAGVLVLESLDHARARGAVAAGRVYAELRGFGVASDAHDVVAPPPDGRGAAACVRAALRDGGAVPPACVGYVNAHATGTMGDTVELAALARTLASTDVGGHDDQVAATLCSTPTASASSSASPLRPLYVSSTKGAMGHLLGAAGSVEAAVAVLSLSRQCAPPTANLSHPCVPHGMCVVREDDDKNNTDANTKAHSMGSGKGDDGAAAASSFVVSVSGGTRVVRLPRGAAASPLTSCEATMSTSFGFGGVNTALLFTRV